MKFIEIVIPRNVNSSNLPDRVLIKLEGILEISVIPMEPFLRYNSNYSHALVIVHESREIELHGTKLDCDRCYEALRVILDSEKPEKVGSLVFPLPHSDDSESDG